MRFLVSVLLLLAVPSWAQGIDKSIGLPGPGGDYSDEFIIARGFHAITELGVQFTPQSSLGGCSGEPRVIVLDNPRAAYLCTGTQWLRLYTEADGQTASPDRVLTVYSLSIQARSGENGIRLEGRARICWGNSNMCFYSDGTKLISEASLYMGAQSLEVGIIGAGNGQYIGMSGPSVWFVPVNSTPGTLFKGSFWVSNIDGRAYLYNGAETLPFSMTKEWTGLSVDFGSLDAAGGAVPCQRVTVTIAGALATDKPTCHGLLALPLGVRGACDVTGANTLTVEACNFTGSSTGDLSPITISVEVGR